MAEIKKQQARASDKKLDEEMSNAITDLERSFIQSRSSIGVLS